MEKFDIIVIGAGSGGLSIAMFMNRVGFKTLLISKTEESIGGDCLNTGCVPSKAIIHCAKAVYGAREAESFGLKMGGSVDLQKVKDYVHSKIETIREHENAEYFRGLGLTVAIGGAKFTGSNSVEVSGTEYTAKRIVLATGSRARELKIPGIENVDYLTNENVFDLDKLPGKFVVIGGGPIGMELGQVFHRLGSEVTIIETGDKFLPKETPESAEILKRQLEREGIKFLFETKPVEFKGSDKLVVEDKDGKKSALEFDNVLVSIGRQLNIDGLDIEKAGIELDESRFKLKVDDYLRTTNKSVFTCGDVAGHYQFTHAAELHAGVILSNFFKPRPFWKKVNYDHLSWVTYTYPEIATFGLNEHQLHERGVKYKKLVFEFEEDDRHIVDNFSEGKLVLYSAKDKILGGSMVAPQAGEMFQELVLANTAGIPMKSIFGKIYPYPTASRVNKRVIALEYANKLTPFAKKLLKAMY